MKPCKSSTCATMRKLALLLLPFTPVALPQQACSGSTFRCSGCSSLRSRSTSPRDMSPKMKPERDSLSWNKDSASFKNQLLEEATDVQKASKMWEISEKLIGLKVHSVVRNLDFVEIFSFVDDL
ncbi:hypothetical protein EZV62_008342 [Acer yangbiense]|uniref:Uncharacterized protein n=1 Tax=Acer yangbiense TaxID=1000413 RepID=A0A5C7ICV6_9ROSI|nr:hypothetical protein EZV62_008342 [Acer yangbiense]